MIRSLNILDGFATRLPGLAERSFSFGPGVTVLWGQNASGKSTLLNILAAHCGIRGGGWTTYQDPTRLQSMKTDSDHETVLPRDYRRLSPGQCAAEVDWDGTPTFFWNAPAGQVRSSSFFDSMADSPDGLTDMDDQIVSVFAKPSTGQQMIAKLVRVEGMISSPPDLLAAQHPKHWNSTWENNWDVQRDYFASLSPTGEHTILMDEPDSGLSIPNEHALWTLVLPRLMEGRQIIIATHSQMLPRLPLEFDVIELTPGYWARCLDVFSHLGEMGEHELDTQDQEIHDRVLAERLNG